MISSDKILVLWIFMFVSSLLFILSGMSQYLDEKKGNIIFHTGIVLFIFSIIYYRAKIWKPPFNPYVIIPPDDISIDINIP